jgi:hypothetical protein
MKGKTLYETMTRGGKREGAGRKPRKIPREAITVRLEPEHAAKLRDICKAHNVSQAAWVTEKIKKSRTKTSLKNTKDMGRANDSTTTK